MLDRFYNIPDDEIILCEFSNMVAFEAMQYTGKNSNRVVRFIKGRCKNFELSTNNSDGTMTVKYDGRNDIINVSDVIVHQKDCYINGVFPYTEEEFESGFKIFCSLSS